MSSSPTMLQSVYMGDIARALDSNAYADRHNNPAAVGCRAVLKYIAQAARDDLTVYTPTYSRERSAYTVRYRYPCGYVSAVTIRNHGEDVISMVDELDAAIEAIDYHTPRQNPPRDDEDELLEEYYQSEQASPLDKAFAGDSAHERAILRMPLEDMVYLVSEPLAQWRLERGI